ncbi:hypothetical protein [Pedococcus sp. 5OH_020]|uniref:hypothetical protein n=1 Tax=Pedococcus sp. 5OH_020 TaxID=2989814 RepID=UPI0022E9E5EC|nr:hypothetical protein [Pedococcus sp. 5OH_020]
MNSESSSGREGTGGPNRRALLHSGGAAVVAGLAGFAVAETVLGGTASAAPGDPVVIGASNNAAATVTSLAGAPSAGPTFAVAHTGGLAPLRLVQQAVPATEPALVSGDLTNYGGDLYYTTGDPNGPFTGFVYTSVTANQLVPINPQRVVDTRTLAGRSNITNVAGNLDSAGRLLAGHSIVVDLSDLEVAATAAYCNLTAVGPLKGGFMTLWPGGVRPATSTINFAANAVIANFAVTGTSAADRVSIYSSATTHLLLDITAFAVGDPGQVNPAVMAAAASSASRTRLAARAKLGSLPDWYAPR